MIRNLGFMEARMHYMLACLNGNTQSGMALQLEGPLDNERLVRALAITINSIDALNCKIVDDEQGLRFVEAPASADQLEFVVLDKQEQWWDMFQQENNRSLDAQAALWRIVCCSVSGDDQRHYLYLTFHHAITDASSIEVVIDVLLSTYARLTEDNAVEMEVEQHYPFLPPIEEMLPPLFTQTWDDYTAMLSKAVAPDPDTLLPFAEHVDVEQRVTRTEYISLDKATLARVEEHCQQRNIPLNSYLSAALIKSYQKTIDTAHDIAFHIAFSLRRLGKVSNNSIGCYIAVVPMGFTQEEASEQLQQVAKTHHKRLSAAIMKVPKHPRAYDAKTLESQTHAVAGATRFVCNIGFSFGEFNVKEHYGPLELKAMYSSVNRAAGMIAVAVQGVRHNDKLDITINHTVPNLDSTAAEKMCAEFNHYLLPENLATIFDDQPELESTG